MVELKNLQGVKRFLLFFGSKATLNAVRPVIKPRLFGSVMDAFDHTVKNVII